MIPRYGDYLYEQGNFTEAVSECARLLSLTARYEKTIGLVEPSYIIKKFLDAQRLPNLTEYLESLHKQGLANKDHTTLLLNCYSKLGRRERLKEFVYDEEESDRYDEP